MSLNTSLMDGEMPVYSMPQPTRYPSNAPTTYNKSYPTASSYTGSGKPQSQYTGPTSSYPLASSGAGYGSGPYTGGRSYTGSTSTAPQQYTGSTSTAPQQYTGSTSTAPQQYTGSTSTAPQQYSGSTSTAPQQYSGSTSTAPQQYSGSTSQYPAPVHSSSTSSYPATAGTGQPRETLASTTSYAASTVNNNMTSTKQPYNTQPSTYSRAATARSHASLSNPAARLVQRGPPPRFRPWMIIFVTMSLGFLFIGIVLTVVAHWPGYTSIGSDPLEIVGPVLLAAGGAGLITCVVLSIVHSKQEKVTFMKKIAASQRSIYNSRMTMQQSMHSIPAMEGQSTMVKHPSTSTYGAQYADGDSGHPSTQTYNSNVNHSYEHDSDASEQGAGKFEVYRIDTLPDPNASHQSIPTHQENTNVPQPVRTRTRDTKKKVTANPAYPAAGAGISTDPNYQPQPVSAGRNSPMAGSGALGSAVGSPMSGAPDLSGGGSRSNRQMHDYSGDGFDMYDPNGESARRGKEKPKKKSRKPKREAEALQASGIGDDEGGFQPDPSYQRPQEPLRIAIRAQPGAQVSITPGFSRHTQETGHDSAETEI